MNEQLDFIPVPKEIKTEKEVKKEYGNTVVNFFISSLKDFQGTASLDGKTQDNRKFSYLLMHKIKKQLVFDGKETDNESIKKVFTLLLKKMHYEKNGFHKRNATSIKFV